MARGFYRRRRGFSKRKTGKQKRRYTSVERTAFYMGQVQRGLKNPESRISASFERGRTEPKRSKRKSLF